MEDFNPRRRLGWIERLLILTLVVQLVLVIVLAAGWHPSEALGFFRSFYQDVTRSSPH